MKESLIDRIADHCDHYAALDQTPPRFVLDDNDLFELAHIFGVLMTTTPAKHRELQEVVRLMRTGQGTCVEEKAIELFAPRAANTRIMGVELMPQRLLAKPAVRPIHH